MPVPSVQSPCIKVCTLDRRLGRCTACLRTLDEITAWGRMSDAERAHIMAQLPARK